jgi:hypothetical protein
MAQRTTVHLIDDLDGTAADQSVTFAFQGAQYEIDLSQKNLDKLEKALAPYLGAARKVGGRGVRRSAATSSPRSSKEDLGAIREWARANGYEVSARGRISQSLKDAYAAAR